MRGTTRTVAVAGISAVALLAAGCGGGSKTSTASSSGGTGKTGGSVMVNGCNPQNPLIPANTNETCGGNVNDNIFAGLVHYNSDTAKPENDMAQSIETKDNQNFTIKLVHGYKFQDGTEVKAKNFVDTWNYAAYGPNGYLNSYFFSPIAGYNDVQCGAAADCTKAKPKAKTMSGLKMVDDYTFTIKTSEKVSNLPVRLGYSAFFPMPDAFFKDPKGFGDKPIGAGPYKLDAWTKNSQIQLSKFANYSGKFPGHADKLTFKIYQDIGAAYNDLLANNIDVIDQVPTSALAGDKYKSDLPSRNISKPVGVFQSITVDPKTDPRYANVKVRQAISMAIDRAGISKAIFNNTRTPATGWVSPVVDGYKAGACSGYCTYDPAKAKALFQEGGGFASGKITLSYNADAPHKAWTEAVCNSVKNALGVDCVATPVVDFKTFRSEITAHKMKGLFRTGWQMDYPSIEDFLAPLYVTGASSNDGRYSDPAFDKLVNEAAAQTDSAAANAKYQEAERVLAKDMPVIPTWYSTAQLGWSTKVNNVHLTPFGTPDYRNISLK